MIDFGEIKNVPLRNVWPHEAHDFTPWLANNISALGNALGLELELTDREAPVGDFSLDLLAKDLGSSKTVIIENQLTQTDHDHLGKLLTYAAGYNAGFIIWVADIIRDEHRQALEWLNQRTDSDTQFFAVVVEILKIDDSKPAYKFKPIVSPNEWQKSKKQNTSGNISSKGERYRSYFQRLIDELRTNHKFTGAKIGQPQNWYSFSSGTSGFTYSASFAQNGNARAEVFIDVGDQERNKKIFDELVMKNDELKLNFNTEISWERLDDRIGSRIALYTPGTIDDSDSELEEIHNWHINSLLNLKKIFGPFLKELTKNG